MQTVHMYEFIELARTLNFTAASRALNMTQPALSNHIKRLEQELHVPLIVRSDAGRPARLTPAGEIVLDFAQRMMSLEEELGQSLMNLSSELKGRMVVRLPRQEYSIPLIDWLGGFVRDHPYAELETEQWGPSDAVADLKDHVIDLACLGAYTSLVGMSERIDGIGFLSLYDVKMGMWVDATNDLARRGSLRINDVDGLDLCMPANHQHALWVDATESFETTYGCSFKMVERYCTSLEDFAISKVRRDDVVLMDERLAKMPAVAVRSDRKFVPFESPVAGGVSVAYRADDDNPLLLAFLEYLQVKRDEAAG